MKTKKLIEALEYKEMVFDGQDIKDEIIEKLRQLEDLQVLIHEVWVAMNKQYDIVRLSTSR